LRCILPQARNNPIGIRDLVAAKPENVGRAGKLLCKGSPILLGNSGILNGNAADDRDRKVHGNRVHSHVCSFFLGIQLACLFRVAQQASEKMRQRDGSGQTKM
jgi:hypothetical protein